MRLRSLMWLLVSIACFIGAFYFWQLGNRWSDEKKRAPAAAKASAPHAVPTVKIEHASTSPAELFTKPNPTNAATSWTNSSYQLKYRVSNSEKTAGQLAGDSMGVILANALIDLRRPLNLDIPDAFKSKENPGAYIVQSRGAIDDSFRARLRGAGAEIVSYIPNNAYLVRASTSGAQLLRGTPGVQAVLPYEPYYKVDARLLDLVLNKDSAVTRPEALNVVVFADALTATREALEKLGGVVLAQGHTPFGVQLTLSGIQDIPAVAGLPGVGNVEGYLPRRPANDLARARVGVALNSTNADNYIGLSGKKVMVSVNDSGVDGDHPDLTGRVFGPFGTIDLNGHGTHVAGIIAGNGSRSTTVSNAPGSFLPPYDKQFRGMAHEALLYALSIDTNYSDFELQQASAQTNAIISNNSWGYGDNGYNIASASYDAAVRDSIPGLPGSQSVTYVFAAGNDGGGSDSGLGGAPQSILSPGTAKNVITVGAIEQFRNITNEVVAKGQTNAVWVGETDSDDQVAAFSARGNVGIGVEGDFGRVKPDVVAPGVFLISTRSDPWDEVAYYSPTSIISSTLEGQIVEPDTLQRDSIYVPGNAVGLIISVHNTEPPMQDMPIYVRENDFPTTGDPNGMNTVQLPGVAPLTTDTTWFFAVGNPTNVPIEYSVTTTLILTNELGDYFTVLSNLNNQLGDEYRFESGTSMAAPVVSGTLALIADFFTNKLGTLPSPALMKAMIINGARPVSDIYDLDPRKDSQAGDIRNYQGWGLINLTNSLPSGIDTNGNIAQLTGGAGTTTPLLIFDQDSTNALATGDSRTLEIKVAPEAAEEPLRVTLVWTDPPGNPAAGIKLVNDLDLVVTNKDSQAAVYYGNDIPEGANFTSKWDTNGLPKLDNLNNVETVIIPPPLGTNYLITVYGRSVNVNAVTAHTNKVAQDFALVISAGAGVVSNALTVTTPLASLNTAFTNVTYMTNQFGTNLARRVTGGLLLNQHVGANSPLIGNDNNVPLGANTTWGSGGTNGVIYLGSTNQWHFYVLTNEMSFTNAAFVTFLPPTLAVPRMGVTNYDEFEEISRYEADIDMYVSRDSALLNLDPGVLTDPNTSRAVTRGGTEVIALTNAQSGAYYVGVHAQDRQAAEYGFFGGFSELPFSEEDGNRVRMFAINVPEAIPDGTPADPGAARILSICVQPVAVRRVVVEDLDITHENFGDLIGNLSHNQVFTVLHNHRPGNGRVQMTFEDNEETGPGNYPLAQRSDGPGSLRDFVGERGEGLWLLTEIDDALGYTGRVNDLTIVIDRQPDPGSDLDLEIQPNSFAFTYVDVPPEATNLIITIMSNTLPVELYVRRDDFPTQTEFDYFFDIPAGGATNFINTQSIPPLQPGRYYVGIYNPNPSVQNVRVRFDLEYDINGVTTIDMTKYGSENLFDDAVTYSTMNVPFDRRIARVDVGVAIQHPRISDLALTLVAPSGKRILLSENRGNDTANMGFVTPPVTNFFTSVGVTAITNSGAASTNILTITNQTGVLVIEFDFYQLPDTMDVYYGGTNIFSSGLVNSNGTVSIPFGPGNETNLTIIINENANPNSGTSWTYTPKVITQDGTFFIFSENNIVTGTNMAPKTQLPIKFAAPPFLASSGDPRLPSTILIYTNDFESGVGGEWSHTAVSTTPAGARNFLGQFGNDVVTLTQSGLPLHSRVTVGFELFMIGTWDGYGPLDGPDHWMMRETGALTPIIDATISNMDAPSKMQSFPENIPAIYPGFTGSSESNTLGYVAPFPAYDSVYKVVRTFAHSNATLMVECLASNLQGVADESWGLDNVYVSAYDPGFQFYFPEESLEDLVADNALGEWKLEIWDNRVGPVSATNSVLLGWQLRFVFDREIIPMVPLVHDVPVTNSIPPCGMQLYVVDVPLWAEYATNTLISVTPALPVNVFFTTNDLPTTNGIAAFTGTSGVAGILTTTTNAGFTPPPVNPGGRYFIGVFNPCDNGTNVTVEFKVEFDTTALSNNLPVISTNMSATLPRYFYYDVSTNATAVSFRLTNMSGNFDLVAHRGGPLPTPANNHYGSFNPGTFDEDIIIFTNSTPVPLTPGRWYLGVFNNSGASNVFTIVATEYTNAFPTIITLTNGIPYTNAFAAGESQYYRYVVSPNGVRAQFEALFPSGDVTLVVRRGLPLPSIGDADYESANPFLNDEWIAVVTNSVPVRLNPGNWFLTVVNVSGGPVDYSAKATEWFETGRPVVVTNIVVEPPPPGSTNPPSFCITWTSLPGVQYHVQGITNLGSTNWIAVSPTIVATNVTTTYCVPITGEYQFFRVVEGIALSAFAPPQNFSVVPYAFGPTNGFMISWRGSAASAYQLQWSTNLAPPFWTAFAPTGMTSTNMPPPGGFAAGVYSFFDDGTQTPPPPQPMMFYRAVLLP